MWVMQSTLSNFHFQDLVLMVIAPFSDEVVHKCFRIDLVLQKLLLNSSCFHFWLSSFLTKDRSDFIFPEILLHERHLFVQCLQLRLEWLVHRKLFVVLLQHLRDLDPLLKILVCLISDVLHQSWYFLRKRGYFSLLKVKTFELLWILSKWRHFLVL